jgi:hypothetical protein
MRRESRQKGRDRAQTLEFWFRRKFNLPPTDPRFLDLTLDDLTVEYWAWYFHEHPDGEVAEDDDFDKDAVIAAMESGDPGDWEPVT